MQELQMKVYKGNKSFFLKFKNKLLKDVSSNNNKINSIKINMKRKQIEKVYSVYLKKQNNKNLEEFEYEYLLYIDSLDKYIINKIYKRAQNGEANEYEKKLLENYYMIITIKEKDYDEYKYKKEMYLLDEDYKGLKNNNKLNDMYEKIYFSKVVDLYNNLFNYFKSTINLKDDRKNSLEKIKVYLNEFKQKALYCKDKEIQKKISDLIKRIKYELILKNNVFAPKNSNKKIQIKKYITKNTCYKINKIKTQKNKEVDNENIKCEESRKLEIKKNKKRGNLKNDEKSNESSNN